MNKHNYEGNYTYCYCTKSSHFQFVLEEVLSNGAQIETSSAFDIPIIHNLHKEKKITKTLLIICNGFKRPKYIENIISLINNNFTNCIPVLDNLNELIIYEKLMGNLKLNKSRIDEERFHLYFQIRFRYRHHRILQGENKTE